MIGYDDVPMETIPYEQHVLYLTSDHPPQHADVLL
jgi:hypothetical protein